MKVFPHGALRRSALLWLWRAATWRGSLAFAAATLVPDYGASCAEAPGMQVCLSSGRTAYVSPDMATIFNIGGKRTGKAGGRAQLVFEAPEGVKVADADYQGSASKIALQEEALNGDGFAGIRYSLNVDVPQDYPAWLQFYLMTSWTPGQRGKARLYLKTKDGAQAKDEIELVCVAIPKAAAPKRIIAAMAVYNYAPTRHWPNFLGSYKALGLNTLALCSNRLYNPEPDEEVDSLIKSCLENGIWVAGQMWEGALEEMCKDPDAQQVNLVGTRVKQQPCPSYRGPLFQKCIEKAKSVVSHGISWLDYDEEGLFSGDNPSSICFCERCKAKFKEFLSAKYPNLQYLDPSVSEADFAKHPELDKAWQDFKVSMVADVYATLRKEIAPEVEARKACSGPRPGLIMTDCIMPRSPEREAETHLHDLRKLSVPLDYLVPMTYTGFESKKPAWVGKTVEVFNEQMARKDAGVIAAVDAGDSWKCVSLPNEYVRDDVLEAVMSGAKGYIYWKYTGLDGLDFRYLSQTNSILAKVEDVILDGTPKEVKILEADKRVLAKARECGGSGVLLVSEYLKSEPVKATVEFPTETPKRVIDLYTDEVVTTLTKESCAFPVVLDKDRARLFLITK